MSKVQVLQEKNWKKVSVQQAGRYSTPYGLEDPIDNSYSWYRRFIRNSGKRDEKLRRYDAMDKDSVEISRALDIVAEDVSSCNADRDEIFILEYEDSINVKKTTMKVMDLMKDQWKERTRFKEDFYDHVRDTIKYGAKFFLKRPDGSLKEIVNTKMVGYVLDQRDESKISHYLYDDGKSYTNKEGDTIEGRKSNVQSNDSGYLAIPVSDLLVMKVGSGPFGESILEKAFSTWRRLQLLEDSVVVYRVVRAPERRVFYIDVGDMPASKATGYVEQIRLKMKQRQITRKGKLDSEFDPHSVGEDFYIPQNSDGRGSRIDTLQGGTQTGELDDVRYFARKLAAALRVPSSMVDTYSDQRDKPMYNDGRIGQIYEEEMRYMGYVKRLQLDIAESLGENFCEFCKDREIEFPKELIFMINEPHNFAQYKETEVNQSLLNVYNSVQNIGHISSRFALEKYMMLDAEEIAWNEEMALKEMGLTDEQIKKMEDHVRLNLVYGDKRLGSEYGIEGGDGMGRRF